MSRFWGHIMKIVPSFTGSEAEAKQNFLSHEWRTVDLDFRFGMTGLGKVVECAICGVLSDTASAHWPCGQAPKPVELNQLEKRRP